VNEPHGGPVCSWCVLAAAIVSTGAGQGDRGFVHTHLPAASLAFAIQVSLADHFHVGALALGADVHEEGVVAIATMADGEFRLASDLDTGFDAHWGVRIQRTMNTRCFVMRAGASAKPDRDGVTVKDFAPGEALRGSRGQ